jgi:hypothetical protein
MKISEGRLFIFLYLLIVMVVIFAVFITSMPASHPSGSVDQVRLIIDYSGSWDGILTTYWGSSSGGGSSMSRFNGTGWQYYTIPKGIDPINIEVTVQKRDASSNTLTVTIEMMDRTILRTANTTAAFGPVTVRWADQTH